MLETMCHDVRVQQVSSLRRDRQICKFADVNVTHWSPLRTDPLGAIAPISEYLSITASIFSASIALLSKRWFDLPAWRYNFYEARYHFSGAVVTWGSSEDRGDLFCTGIREVYFWMELEAKMESFTSMLQISTSLLGCACLFLLDLSVPEWATMLSLVLPLSVGLHLHYAFAIGYYSMAKCLALLTDALVRLYLPIHNPRGMARDNARRPTRHVSRGRARQNSSC